MPKEEKIVIDGKERVDILPVEKAVCAIQAYNEEIIKDAHGRYMSWCHCYKAFTDNRNTNDEKVLDYLSLHLAFYLASWGMYRGSSFLLHKDYKVHIPIVRIIMEEKYNSLMAISAEKLIDSRNLDLLDELSEKIRRTYAEELPSLEGTTNNATDTLITKILLGTLGCVPAYDRYYVQTVRKYRISTGKYNSKSVKEVAQYYLDNQLEFEKVRTELSVGGIKYPAMKLMDMCMWQIGFEND